jgi:hypothetical protein
MTTFHNATIFSNPCYEADRPALGMKAALLSPSTDIRGRNAWGMTATLPHSFLVLDVMGELGQPLPRSGKESVMKAIALSALVLTVAALTGCATTTNRPVIASVAPAPSSTNAVALDALSSADDVTNDQPALLFQSFEPLGTPADANSFSFSSNFSPITWSTP